MRKSLWVICLLPLLANAQIYQSQDANGNVIYTDQPSPNAVPIKVKEPQSMPDIPQHDATQTPQSDKVYTSMPDSKSNQAIAYSSIQISSPAANSTIHDNSGTLTVQVDLRPELHGGDKVVLYLDGRNAGESQSASQFTLENVDRGSHQLQAKVLDSKGKELIASGSVTVYLQRTHI